MSEILITSSSQKNLPYEMIERLRIAMFVHGCFMICSYFYDREMLGIKCCVFER